MDPLQAQANYSKVCQLLIDKGGDALRNVLKTEISTSPPPSTLDSLLNTHKKSLKKIRYSVINAAQWKLLFPASGSADLNNFDITLLTILLRNICGLSSPAAGWNVMPPPGDTSISAEILRIKMFRNEVYGHISSAQLDDTKFETLWQEISQPLIKLGISQQDIDELKKAPLSPEEEGYIEKLKEWKVLEDNLISKINDVERKITGVENEVFSVKDKLVGISHSVARVEDEIVHEKSSAIDKLAKFVFKGKVEELCKKFQDGTRKWFFDDFEEWLDDEKSRVLILTGGPGVGKSVLSAKICEIYEKRGQLAASHFCDFRFSDYRDPNKILQSLASQMCDNVDGFRDKLAEVLSREHSRHSLQDAFRVFLSDPLHALHRIEPIVIVVDALDESKTPIKSELLDLISNEFSQLPKWIKVFISTRPELQVREKLEQSHLNPVEITSDHDQHNRDLQQFIQRNCPRSSPNLFRECQGSFLYAYYLVNQIKHAINPNINVDVPKGISGFYEKQFERLKNDLQCYEQRTQVSIFRNFINVVAASKDPLPFRFLFVCMDLFSEQFHVRKTIVGIMSEILPVYDDCLTVFHKSLWDWLKLDGYEEHAYAADVADGKKRLWDACKKIYTDICSCGPVSELKISQETKYALEKGWDYLLNADAMEDFHWFVNVKVNYCKFLHILKSPKGFLDTKLPLIFKKIESRTGHLYWDLFQLYTFSKLISKRLLRGVGVNYMYLQYLANKPFSFVDNAAIGVDARKILDEKSIVWLEEVTDAADSGFRIIANTFHGSDSKCDVISSSPDNSLLAIKSGRQIIVYKLPSLTILFTLILDHTCFFVRQASLLNRFFEFSPDSSYFLFNTLQTWISIKSQDEFPFIPHGPAEILCCAFSSCGTKLVSLEEKSIKLWDVRKKVLLAISECSFKHNSPVNICFSSSDLYIFVFGDFALLNVSDSTTLSESSTHTWYAGNENCTHLISPSFRQDGCYPSFHIKECCKFLTGEKIGYANKYCSESFAWKGSKCVMILSGGGALVVYDYLNQQVVDVFHLSCLPTYKSATYLSNLGESNFLACLDGDFVFVLTLESSSESIPFPLLNNILYPEAFAALSPDKLYVAFTYNAYPILKIMAVGNGKIVQSIALKQAPLGCWWSELYLWVVYEGPVVVKYPYNATETQIVGNCGKEFPFDCQGEVLKFAEGVLVCKLNDKIAIFTISDGKLSRPQILYTKFEHPNVVVSSDGCAVLLIILCGKYEYELWEIGSENKWELHSTGKLNPSTIYGCLTGKQNSRSFSWLVNPVNDLSRSFELTAIDSLVANPGTVHQLPIKISDERNSVIYVGSELLICYNHLHEIVFIGTSAGNIIGSIDVGEVVDFFFIPKQRLLLLFCGDGIFKRFKIHNIDKYLPDIS